MFMIDTSLGPVAGFDRTHQCVQFTSLLHPKYIRKFNSRTQAQQFIDTYANCGYGFGKDDADIKEI